MQAPKKIKETDAIFDRLSEVNPAADGAEDVLRLSLDSKTAVKIGLYSRGGKSRTQRKAADHDFKPKQTLTPYGIFLPRYDDLYLYFTSSRVTSDFMVDVLDRWWLGNKQRFAKVKTLVINQDNGPENQSRRTQFLKRIVSFAYEHELMVRLAYYPPYHSKYNPIEHCWGILEQHWNGKHPVVELLSAVYEKGVRLSAKEMEQVEKEVDRLPNLGKWFVDIHGHEPLVLG